ncbi:MAG: hypothetical protein ACI9XK_005177, partial [Granulosicoccus sp.]
APRIHGELRVLRIEISQSTVAKYMVNHQKPSSQTWRTFLDNHVAIYCEIGIVFTLKYFVGG